MSVSAPVAAPRAVRKSAAARVSGFAPRRQMPTSGALFSASTPASKQAFMGKSLSASSRQAAAAAPGRRSVARAAIGDSLEEFLLTATPDPRLRQVLICLAEACRTIAYKVRTASCDKTACLNDFGDDQLAVDVLADKLLFEALRYSGVVASASSEEQSDVVPMGGPDDGFSVAFDPLDGSSIIDTNFSVGTIFGIWPGKELTGINGRGLAAGGVGIYGPRTTFVFAIDDGCHEFLLQDDGKWIHARETREIKEGKIFAPGNLRATFENPGYEKLVSHWIGEKYQLRYTGGMVPDVCQILVKGQGVFANAISQSAPAKLRVLYEVAPIGHMIECAGGYTTDGEKSVLDIDIVTTVDRSQVCYGSKDEVARFEKLVGGKISQASLQDAKV